MFASLNELLVQQIFGVSSLSLLRSKTMEYFIISPLCLQGAEAKLLQISTGKRGEGELKEFDRDTQHCCGSGGFLALDSVGRQGQDKIMEFFGL